MKYTKFIIKNFKGIENVKISLNDNISNNIFTLVGLNESGKTSILEAITFFQKAIEPEDAHKLIPKKSKHLFTKEISVQALVKYSAKEMEKINSFTKKNYNFNFEKKDINEILLVRKIKFNDNNDNDISEIELSQDLELKTKRGQKIITFFEWKKKNIGKSKNFSEEFIKKFIPKIVYYKDFLFDFPKAIVLDSNLINESKEKETNEKYLSVIKDALFSIDENLSVEKHLLKRLESTSDADKESLSSLINRLEKTFEKEILQEWNSFFTTSKNNLKKTRIKIETRKLDDKWSVSLKIGVGDEEFPVAEKSLGFRWFFAFLFFNVFRKKGRNSSKKFLLLFDEPASNLHQTLQQKLLKKLQEESETNSQIIYSTHSHHLIDPRFLSGIYILKNKVIDYENPENSKKTTEITVDQYKHFVIKFPEQISYFQPILDALEYKPSELEMVEPIVMLEGKNDYYTFKYFSKVFSTKKTNLKFFPGRGANTLDLAIRLNLAWGNRFIVLLDSDNAGQNAKCKYEEIGADVKNKIFTLGSINEEWKSFSTEKLFSEADQINIINFIYEETESLNNLKSKTAKKKFNRSIEELYIKNEKIELSLETREKFQKIFKFIEEKINSQKQEQKELAK